ncbi:hypothetical protein ACWER9_06430 [Micromonospora sp. NPDC003944]
MSRLDTELRRMVDERLAMLLPKQPGRMGLVVTVDPASAACTVIFDGDVTPVPVKRWSHVRMRPGDRCGLQQYEGDWVVVGAFASDATWVASASTSSAAVTAETSVIALTGVTFRAGMAYRLTLGGQYQSSVVNISFWRVRNATATTGADWGQFGHYPAQTAANPYALLGEHWLRRTASSDLENQTVSVNVNASTGTVTHLGSATKPRYLMLEEWGPAAKCPQGFAVS